MEEKPAVVVENFRELITATGRFMESLPEHVQVQPEHSFAGGLYRRTLTMPKDTVWVSKVHKRDNFAFIISGECSVLSESGAVRLKAPCQLTTLAGTQRILQIHEDCTWMTVHAIPPELGEDVERVEEFLACNTFDEYDQCLLEQLKKLEVVL